MAVRAGGGARCIPIDSEHNAIFQCLPRESRAPAAARRACAASLLTASGGPFLRLAGEPRCATPRRKQACAHPNWVMGRKISVDSATLMNKGLELIEACRLFGLAPGRRRGRGAPRRASCTRWCEYVDGSVLAQLGAPDMRTPIAHALAWPRAPRLGRRNSSTSSRIARLDFGAPDPERFPCLGLAQAAARAGGTAPAILNAANEVAVQAFLERRLNFTDDPGGH